MNIDTAYTSKRLKAVDMGDNGEITLTIRAVEMEEVKGQNGKEWKPVLHFHEIAKSLVLNVTNKESIKSLYGAMTENWIGKRVTFFTIPVQDFGGNTTDGVRVKTKGLPPRNPNAPPMQPHPTVNVRDLPPQSPELPRQKTIAEQLQDAKRAVWNLWKEMTPDAVDDAERKRALENDLKARFNKELGSISIIELQTLVRTGFQAIDPNASPISEEPVVPEEEVPF